MKSRGIRLQYSFQTDGQRGADLHNPLFDLLCAVREHGSIQHAARATDSSYPVSYTHLTLPTNREV